ncbi:odorant receptor 131-2-like, partial [Etheostoma cragini]|uniref:odorant receptor 131-2-like n=1 Tax=Etheostoma cragini TaxID=417921 RepID=UPI00155EBBF8
MSNANLSQTNVTVGRGLLERVLFSTMTTVPCCVFLFINGTMLFTLRSKTVFCETSRYILLFNLLFADTVQLALSQLIYILAALGLRLTYPSCGVLTMLSGLTNEISPLTLVVMSLERYVAVCYPLRHSTLVTIRNTEVAIVGVWVFSSLNVLTQVILLLDFPFENLESLEMKDFCAGQNMLLDRMSDDYNKAFTYFLFVSAGVAVTSSYIGVMIVARSAST